MFKAANEKVTQNFGAETRNDMKLTVKYVTGKRSGFSFSFLRAVERERVDRRVWGWEGERGLVSLI